ncbi:pyridoxamine 5'-phosphate oxidase family protein [Acinetobacter radioresistens]|uniref:pyridoxamine 5'-phosphate oxidase family protein n=1 Tax=Acinetobacter radioresistens TaxID=40216 RepID=UPI000C33FF03|nr:pyridoxamine 5'-phosphate oxidase family protein [Acinetobacter radioresistens]MCM1935448.1 pyridoxamine 5'-phosphate oxidase family protein [Acinetobacter radioresistens]MCM1953309.1 pyridoxamine 5'-phosphate oxidase family protein [Acinetobacter radioresistens]MCU4307476.1 pyridoxamine 5'-phosphate oxidase family protein [Acinetobacter radioresistens]MCU4567050.1 pyridoxamine 5'-phosphate oxidase family protein [Acinetobacter radioresistens]PKH27822.1 general stress protein [Acinetobacter
MTEHENREKLWELIKDVRFAMISHQTETHEIHAQPMTMLNSERMDEDQNVYFILKDTNDIVQAVEAGRNQLGLAFSKPSDDIYVSISAHGDISTDRALIDKLWNPWAENWFDGKDDPSVRVLVAKAVSAEYWNVTDNKVTHLLKVLKGNITGKTEEPDSEHKRLDL